MSLRIKDGVDLTQLREFGFELGRVLSAQDPVYAEVLDGCGCKADWWLKMKLPIDEETDLPRRNYDTDDFRPTVEAWVDTRDGENRLWFDAEPESTYHIGMDELDLITDTVFALTQTGLVEEVKN